MRRAARRLACALALGLALVLLAHPIASGASDIWGNVAPASPLGQGGLLGRYPLDHFTLDEHFEAIEASLTGGVHVHGVPPMIAYFLAGVLWVVTSFIANALISLFSFAFSLDLVNGSAATGGAGALGPVSAAIHSIYANVFGAPWLVLAITVVGLWAMWKALVQRRYSETAGALALSLIYVVCALFFVVQPAATIGSASAWTNQMSEAFLSIADHGNPSGGEKAKDAAANQLFELLVLKPWVVLEFGGLEHCVLQGTGGEDSDPVSAPVRPLSSNPARDAQLARRLASGTEVSAEGKVCVNNANKYAPHFLQFGLETDERSAEYEALNHGDSSKLPEADTERKGYRLGLADKPATDAMEEGGQYQRLLIAIVVFGGELGAFFLVGSLAVGIILAQILLLLLLAFAPVALVAAAIPGRGHAFFKGWLEKLCGYLLRKAAYSLILAVLLAVANALASATSAMGWLMSFGLQALFFWAVFLQREKLAESLIGIATGPGSPGRDASLRLVGLYYGARGAGGMVRGVREAAGSTARGTGRLLSRGAWRLRGRPSGGGAPSPPLSFGTTYRAPIGGGYPIMDAPGPGEQAKPPVGATAAHGGPSPVEPSPANAARSRAGSEGNPRQRSRSASAGPEDQAKPQTRAASAEKPKRTATAQAGPEASAQGSPDGGKSQPEGGTLAEDLRSERERFDRRAASGPSARLESEAQAEQKTGLAGSPSAPPSGRRKRRGR